MLGSSVFVLVLVSALAAIAYRMISSSIYDHYNDKLLDVIAYVEDKADADDLARCIQSGTHSDAYDQLQLELNDVVHGLQAFAGLQRPPHVLRPRLWP